MAADGIDIKKIDIIANTHLHGDHCWANAEFQKLSGAKIMLHPLQKAHWKETIVLTSQFFAVPEVEFTEDGMFKDNTLATGEMSFELIPCPGHSPDSLCFYERNNKVLICGDVVFAQNTGRVDLPGGGAEALKQSIETLSQLEIDYLLPGHMGPIGGRQKVIQNFDYIKRFVLDNL
jgi:glyoxylase-like metal-dependent hydrolase (beta-lactamase superfamily II)